jgi:arylsulfatase A-like enzyme
MTGRYSHCNGLLGLANAGWSLPLSERTIVDYLADAGYYTVNVAGQHERRDTASYKYREVLGKPGHRTCHHAADEICGFLKRYDPKQGPFYLNAYSQDVHAPWDREEFVGKYDPDQVKPPPFLPNIPVIRKQLALFYGSISVMDEAMGHVFDTLRETGLEKNTLVIFTTDHGISFPRAKGTLYDPGLTTFVILRWPGHIRPGTVVRSMVGNIDLLPTELELLGLPIPSAVQGCSFAPALVGGTYQPREEIFAERNFHDSFDPVRCVRTTRYKLIRNYSERSRSKLPTEADEEDTMVTLRMSAKPRSYEELYDLEKDPLEFHNVAEDPAYADVLKDLRGRLDGWMDQTHDFLRGGQTFVHHPVTDAKFEGPAVPPKSPANRR